MKIAYFDCIGGASGDMILGALIDAGLGVEALRARLAALRLADFELKTQRVNKNGFARRRWMSSYRTMSRNGISPTSKPSSRPALGFRHPAQALAVFRRMAEVEAGIHAASITCTCTSWAASTPLWMSSAAWSASTRSESRRSTPRRCRWAVASSRARTARFRCPRRDGGAAQGCADRRQRQREGVGDANRRGVALLAGGRVRPHPADALTAVGYGAGGRDLPVPNVVRLLLGDQAAPAHLGAESVVVLETNIDDLNPQIYDHVMARLFKAGALDVFCRRSR